MEKPVVKKGLGWKEYKLKKKEEYKKWKEEKAQKKIKKLEEKSKSNTTTPVNEKVKRDFTVSIAVPGSILDNAQSPELKTYLAGQIARAAAVFNVNEIIVFSETGIPGVVEDDQSLKLHQKNHGCIQLVRILQYLECPQYLRKYYFPIHKDLEYAGLLNPLDSPHHLRVDDESEFREGIVLNKPVKEGKTSGSYVYIGLRKSAVIDKVLEPNVRVTVQLDKEQLWNMLGVIIQTLTWTSPLEMHFLKIGPESFVKEYEGTIPWSAVETRLSLGNHKKNTDVRTYFMVDKNIFLVKSMFTFGQVVVAPETYHVFQMTTVPLALYVSSVPTSSHSMGGFNKTEQFRYTLYMLEPNRMYHVPEHVKYIFICQQKTYFSIYVTTFIPKGSLLYSSKSAMTCQGVPAP